MFCHNCGVQIGDTVKFCPECGAKTALVSDAGSGESQPVTNPSAPGVVELSPKQDQAIFTNGIFAEGNRAFLERTIIIVSSEKDYQNIRKKVGTKEVFGALDVVKKGIGKIKEEYDEDEKAKQEKYKKEMKQAKGLGKAKVFFSQFGSDSLDELKILGKGMENIARNTTGFVQNAQKDGEVPYPVYDVRTVLNYFEFPPGHPNINVAYALHPVFPNLYIPLNEFHRYFRHLKHQAFQELCANLGAKEVYLTHEEIEQEFRSANANAGFLGKGAKVEAQQAHSKEIAEKLALSFPENNKEIREYNSPWMITEPTWEAMYNMRRNNNLKQYEAEFNYTDDMGVTAAVAGKMNGMNVNIGGSFEAIKKERLKYKVIFW